MPLKSISVSNFRCFHELNIPPDGTELSPGINLFIGPNGSGKTSLFNLIRLTVGREPLNSQMEFMVGSKRVGTSSWVHDFNQPDKPWSAKATFELNDGNTEPLVASVELEAGKSGGDQPQLIRKLNDKGVRREPLTWLQGLLRNRVFHMGWPRIVSKLSGSPAFERVLEDQDTTLENPEAFKKAWQRIRAAALEYLEIPDLGEAPQLGPEVFGGALSDENGRPLLENSDGVSHALYLIMEIEKHPWPTTFLIEEPDVYLHPGLQRRFMDYLESRCGGNPSETTAAHQFLIATHSPYLINAVTEMSGRRNPTHRLFQMTREGRAVSVKSIRDNHDQWATLAAIGHRSADVLLPNGLIWVEGPSDVIYLKVWLSKYAEAQQRKLVWGEGCRDSLVWG